MNNFDKIILEGMVNTEAMLKARLKVLKQKRSAGLSVTDEVKRAGRFLDRYQSFMRDWQYWYYDELPGKGDPGPRADKPMGEGEANHVDISIDNRVPSGVLPQDRDIKVVLDKFKKKS